MKNYATETLCHYLRNTAGKHQEVTVKRSNQKKSTFGGECFFMSFQSVSLLYRTPHQAAVRAAVTQRPPPHQAAEPPVQSRGKLTRNKYRSYI